MVLKWYSRYCLEFGWMSRVKGVVNICLEALCSRCVREEIILEVYRGLIRQLGWKLIGFGDNA